jgi:DNA-binding GntR family transcriptional regulator
MSEIGHMPVNQRVYHHMLNMIVSGLIVPGARLDEQMLATEMGVSRTPLREAISRLVEKGLVEYRPYQGNFVRVLSSREVSEIYQVRRALEELAIRLAAEKMTPERLAEARAILDDLGNAMERGDIDGVNEADDRFHLTIARFSENETLIAALDDLENKVAIIRSVANQNPDVLARTAIQRPQILAALESGDANLAAQLLGQHIEYVRQAVVAETEAKAEAAQSTAAGT